MYIINDFFAIKNLNNNNNVLRGYTDTQSFSFHSYALLYNISYHEFKNLAFSSAVKEHMK